jgi:hypothetical protein
MTDETIRDLLIEIRTKVDILVAQHGDHETRIRVLEHAPKTDLAPVEARAQDVETRLRGLERARWILVGAATVAGGAAGKIAGLI